MQLIPLKTVKSAQSAFQPTGWTAPKIRRLNLDDSAKQRLFPEVPKHLLGLTE